MGRLNIIADSSNLVCEEKVKFNEDDENFMERSQILQILRLRSNYKYKGYMTHSQMLGKVKYGLPAKI